MTRREAIRTVCSMWLTYHGNNLREARADVPYKMPSQYEDAPEFNKALRKVGDLGEWEIMFEAWRKRQLGVDETTQHTLGMF